ncbi:hypothetical protein VQ03_18805 [Methylobacterium tarhaniae]|uniref:Acetyltransferase n=1 Tax=Methylobacterium tarhaniae TaxID=1187852 RepID=A0A0J6VFB3_9HYPH|nr:hypothetical protein [Methylobacterium tarhaniae]KMO37741.1 hypothetical protein VQ03_18805 [Methylobacterium tarhaniae]
MMPATTLVRLTTLGPEVEALRGGAEGHFRVVRLRAASPEAATFYRFLGFADTTEPDATHSIPVTPTR